MLRINSPGGTITASDELYRRICEVRDGNADKKWEAKPLVVSMGSLAASGGYYIAMPAKHLIAERSTITGSIGVYASFPNISGLTKKYDIRMNTIKAGEVKDSGSMFHPMTAEERELWQAMVNHAYDQFLSVVEEGRPSLKGQLREVILEKDIPRRNDDGEVVKNEAGKEEYVKYVRRRADGGIFTADEALKLHLVNQIGYLEDAISKARELAHLGANSQAVVYDRPQTLLNSVLGVQAPEVGPGRVRPREAGGRCFPAHVVPVAPK